MNFAIPSLPKKTNLSIGVRSRRRVVSRVQVWVFWVKNSMASSNFGSVRSGRVRSEFRVERLDVRFQSGYVT